MKARVAAGGHPIPEDRIRERYPKAQLNLICLMPHAAHIKVYDNTADADGTAPDPVLVLEMENGRVIRPARDDLEALQQAPDWAKPILEAALHGDAAVGEEALAGRANFKPSDNDCDSLGSGI